MMSREAFGAEYLEKAIAVNRSNIFALIRNYFSAPFIRNVIFSYGFHGHRKKLFDGLMSELREDIEFTVSTIFLTCSEVENIRRMKNDGRDDERIRRAIKNTRQIYDDLGYPRLDTTGMTPDETAEKIIEILELS